MTKNELNTIWNNISKGEYFKPNKSLESIGLKGLDYPPTILVDDEIEKRMFIPVTSTMEILMLKEKEKSGKSLKIKIKNQNFLINLPPS